MSDESTGDGRIEVGDLTPDDVAERIKIAKLEIVEWLRNYIIDPHSVDRSYIDERLDAAKIINIV